MFFGLYGDMEVNTVMSDVRTVLRYGNYTVEAYNA